MAMTDHEIKMVYNNEYDYLMGLLKFSMSKHPESCSLLAEIAEEYRNHVKRSANIDDLPPVPKL